MNNSTNGNDTIIVYTPVSLPEAAIISYNVYLSVTIAFGVPGNILVLFIYLKSKLISSTDWFIIFISIYDLISSLISVPVYLTFTSGAWKYYGNDVICRSHMFVSQSAVLSSTFLICGLAIERFHKVCQPKSTSFTFVKCRNTCVVISVTSAILSLPCFVLYENKHSRCMSATENTLVKLLMAYYTGMLLSFLSAVIILIYTYFRIVVTILRSEFNMIRHGSEQSQKEISTVQVICALITKCCRGNKIQPYTSSYNASASIGLISTNSSGSKKTGEIFSLDQTGSTFTSNNKEKEREITRTTTMVQSVRKTNPDGENDKMANCVRSSPNKNNVELRKYTTMMQPQKIRETFLAEEKARRMSLESRYNRSSEMSTSTSASNNSQVLIYVQRVNENRRLRRSLKTTRIAFFICLIFVLSWIPPWASFINYMLMPPSTKANPTYLAINMFCKMTYLVNTFSNPILYTTLNKTFREKLKKSFCSK